MAIKVYRASSATVSFTTPQEIVINKDDDTITAYQGGTWTVTQSGVWTTGRTWTLASGTDSVAAVQSGTWTNRISDGTDTLAINTDGSLNVANVVNITANSASLSNLSSSTSTQLAIASNSNRKGFILYNDSTANCYVAFAAPASSSSFTMLLNPGMSYQNEAIIYTGAVSAIWASANGALRITELTG